MKHGLISIGTNSTRVLVAEIEGETPQILFRRSIGTRIGEGLKEQGTLSPDAMQRTLTAVEEHVQALRNLKTRYRVIGTSAVRRASNRQSFEQLVEAITHENLETISAEEEARCSYVGAVQPLRSGAATFGVVDLGGGSTEYAVGNRREIDRFVSCEIGAVRLTEAVPELRGADGRVSEAAISRARSIAAHALRPIEQFSAVEELLAVGGTATSLVTLLRRKREPFAYAVLTIENLHRLIEHLRMPLEERRNLGGVDPQRADIILAGALALREVYRASGHTQARVSTNDLLLGFLLRHAG